ncbi:MULTISPECIES: AMP-binding protein [Salinibaculum]|uniref:AMP-binding protein n=1 Tax=Salinibaculum TaxID=2732368 RepID=UPI0030CC32B9
MPPETNCASRGDDIYHPSGIIKEETNAWAFAEEHGASDLDDVLERSWQDVAWFWDVVVDWLDIEFYEDYHVVLDDGDEPQFSEWYVGGRLNIAHNTVDCHADQKGDDLALIWEGENGASREVSYRELRRQSNRVANALQAWDVRSGDTVGLMMPMVPETAAVIYGALKLGAVVVPLFSGFGSGAVARRLRDAECSVLFTADGFLRRGQDIVIGSTVTEAIADIDSLKHVVAYDRLGVEYDRDSREEPWSVAVETRSSSFTTVELDANHPSMLLYSSGTTGRPKGTIQTHAGQLVKTAKDVHFDFDHSPSDRFFWMTDMGWVMGPWTLVGNHALGGTMFMYEGAPDYPDAGRSWQLVEDHSLTVFGTSPTAVRALRQQGNEWLERSDLSSLRILGSTGEPWDSESWRWFYENVGKGECPIINVSGGTEMGGHFLSPLPGQPLKPCTVGKPGLGIDADIVNEQGESVLGTGERGHLVVRSSCPSMTDSLWEGVDRYLEEYWSTWPDIDIWDHGDWAQRDDEGFWYIYGRADEAINVAGRKVGPGEVEEALLHHPGINEAAVVGIPDEITGEAIVAYVILRDDVKESEELTEALRGQVGDEFGKPFRPQEVRFVEEMPTNQSDKILRSQIRHNHTKTE